ncbi:hypothetical protein P2H44_12655 [Albimonas sp. CAU 1670]|uniref:hypothetical protein n=1 Tax=Albimonas sp. CAU 1670 TaxID=3032599 RepID=UPI0023D9B563|nr:hypothetical protein [Albimonas sp. CAU 1670]MDF2233404.1 hypothetical protein [Albimonas sp. CAU 1670]
MPPIRSTILAAALLAASAAPALATVVFESEGWGQSPSGYPGSVAAGEYSAGRFTFSAKTTIDAVAWVGAYIDLATSTPIAAPADPDFHIAVFSVVGSTVGAQIWGGAVDAVSSGGTIATQQTSFAPLTLAAGDYLFAVASLADDPYYMLSAGSSSDDLFFGDADADADLTPNEWTTFLGSAPIFQLSGPDGTAVPLPAPVALLGAGLAALGFAARRKS